MMSTLQWPRACPERSNKLCHPDRSEAEWRDLVFSQRNEDERPDQAGASRHPPPRHGRSDSVTAKLEDFVILSGATASRSGAVAESKDPYYQLKLAAARQGILPCSR